MSTIVVPYHLDERIEGFAPGVVADQIVDVELPRGGPWDRMGVLYRRVASLTVADTPPTLVVSGDCTTSLGVIAGLQQRGLDVGVVWLDAHADFHTEESTTSGYLGGMPLALAAGIGNQTLPRALGLTPTPARQILLVDARDTDLSETEPLAHAGVRCCSVEHMSGPDLPTGPLYVHIDLDVAAPDDVPGLLFPTQGGPAFGSVLKALSLIAQTGRLAATGLAASWDDESPGQARRELSVQQLVAALLS